MLLLVLLPRWCVVGPLRGWRRRRQGEQGVAARGSGFERQLSRLGGDLGVDLDDVDAGAGSFGTLGEGDELAKRGGVCDDETRRVVRRAGAAGLVLSKLGGISK